LEVFGLFALFLLVVPDLELDVVTFDGLVTYFLVVLFNGLGFGEGTFQRVLA
jgi:hypothetical protein